ncbi:Zinc finger, TAZ-type [Ectocarpus siliculosus]|uniref:histone acetyltransferase n=1 Tax=Ectocarpus siliculosus TaxID=2880 RepID=D7FK57_ECTSI|nr:Zinc finger, TAZ-type [Ectocarpus siliculosus]|eukprot:CBJ29267.1 Zinc finger, TAZ-type [Ectocarpus siliculosus]
MRTLDGVGGTRLPNGTPGAAGVDNGGGGGGIKLALSLQRGGGSNSRSIIDGTIIVGTQEISQQESNNTTATAGRAPLHLKRDPNLAPPEGNGSPGSGTPPTDTGGDPCPSCASSHAPHFSSPETVGAAALAAVDSSGLCRCGDKARGGHTGGNPVASADAVAVDSASGGSSAIGSGYPGHHHHHHHQVASLMVATESGVGSGEADAATVVGAPSMPLQRYVDPRQASLGAPNQQSVGGTGPMMVVDARHAITCAPGGGVATRSKEVGHSGGGGGGGGGEPWSVVPQQPEKDQAPVPPRRLTLPVATGVSEAKVEIQQQQQRQQEQQGQEQDVKALQADTMDRLAQSLAQAEQLALSVEARQSELLARPKRRSHPSAKQESAAQSRKVRPKSVPQAGKLPKLEDLGIKVEPIGDPAAAAAAAVATADKTAAVTGVAVPAAAAPAERAASSGLLMPKQRLLIKIPRAAVTAATAHAAEVAAAAKKEDGAAGGETRSTKRGKGKSGVKRARPLAASRASQPPPPPPAPTSRQELPPGCGPPSPSLAAIFGRQVDKGELETAHDGTEHVQTSLASRRVTALSAAAPKELASHVQALRLDYLVQKVRPILTKLMSSGTGPQRGLFNVPVDPLKLGIPDYFKRVPHPMDLGTIKSRLLSMSYTTPEEFASDVRLVFKNAIGFNPETHFVHTWAVQLLNEFDQEYSKQIGKLDEGWAKSLSHSCQLCQGQTCTLCGDKCLKLEPPVIICHHCNKRVVRGGVYHITRDGCRLWCSRCHPGLPPELPTDGDPEGIVAEETAEGGGSSVASAGGDDCGEGGGAAASGSSSTAAEGETPQPQPSVATPPTTGEGRAAAAGSGVLSPGGVSSPSPVQPPPPATAPAAPAPAVSTAERQQPARTPSPASTAAPVEAIANGGGGVNHGSGQNGGGSAATACEGGRKASPASAANGSPPAAPAAAPGRAVSESGSANGATGAPPAASESGGSVGGGGAAAAAAAAAVEEVKAPLKRDLLRRKFDEEISEPWVQCDRCNSWVHQVCALFNARANVGEARFVCPLCRLRNVVTTKKPGSQAPEAATEVCWYSCSSR